MPLSQSFLKLSRSGQLLLTGQRPDSTLFQNLLKQLRSGQLLLIPQLGGSNASTPSFICRLPTELLQIIFRNVIVDQLWEDPDGMYHDAIDIGCTCRQFHRIVQPLIYEHIHLGVMIPPRFRARRLFRTLSESSDLRPLCRHLYVSMEFAERYKYPDDFLFAENLLLLLPNLRSFKLGCGTYCKELWSMLKEVFLRTPGLEDVALPFAQLNGNTLVRIACELELPNLSRLALYGHSMGGQARQASLAPYRWGTSSLKHVTITSFAFDADYVHKFLQWAAALESFEFFYLGNDWTALRRDTESTKLMKGVLEGHGHSLKHIHIESFKMMNTYPSMFEECTKLESIQVNGSDRSWKATEAVDLLLMCPCATTLTITYKDEWSCQGCFAFNLTPAIADMIEKIAKIGRKRQATLKTICIVFSDSSPRGQVYDPPHEEEELYPREFLSERLRPLGIAIRYLSSEFSRNVYKNLERCRPGSREGSFFSNDDASGWDSEDEQDWIEDPDEGEMWRGNIFASRQSGSMEQYIVRRPRSR